ncbi:hypothetical protein L1049_024638 [Liquidambar formosana]|uniref:Protein kinase domain-containing protein n=1 Tax=Liquidambar formosana TaxID=63359 RepID=A0AAP0X5A1_LIQFO
MEKLHCHNILLPLFLLPLQFSSLLLSSAYTLPDQYFINCGSDQNSTVNDRTFIGDNKYGSLSHGQSTSVQDTNTSKDPSLLYQTARIYKCLSPYELDIVQSGTYVVRLHFRAFSSANLFSAHFNVSTSTRLLLSNFSVQNGSNSPVIKEFLLTINVPKFRIYFTPSRGTSFAFVNAIEVFLAPESFIPSNPPLVTPTGSNSTYNDSLSQLLQIVYRINVGGSKITPDDDTLLRNWITDDDFLLTREAAIIWSTFTGTPNYMEGNATNYTAPDAVYQTAEVLNITNFSKLTWRFNVSKNSRHLVRVHFCDIVSGSLNILHFNLSIYGNFSWLINPYLVDGFKMRVPFKYDFVVDSDDFGFINISVVKGDSDQNKSSFLNGVEIMELMKVSNWIPPTQCQQKKTPLSVILGSLAGGFAVICILLAAVWFGLKRRKAKSAETFDDKSSRISEKDLNLGLKMTFSEIKYATKKFNKKMVIGEGGFGKVYKGTLRNGKKVAVKRSEPGHGQGIMEFQAEILVLSKIRHRHLVSLIGYCDERAEMILVYEFMEKGTLRDHLYGDSEGSTSHSELSWKQRLEICIDSAKGLHYLHTALAGGIIHRDVKSTNILLDEHYVAKVADFGLSKSGPLDHTHVSTDVKGSFGYLDPEYFRCLQLTDKSDVYSFGVVLLEVLCARPAIISTANTVEEVNLAEWGMSWKKKGQLEKIIDPLLVGKINPNSLRKFGETAEKCLKECGVDRPTMADVLWDLEYVLQLQQTAVYREPHEDSTVDASMELQLPVVQRFPSHSFPVDEGDESIVRDDDGSDTYASDVFSQLKIDDAR